MNIASQANQIAKYFINKTAGRATPAIMKKTHTQAKTLLQSGYAKEEIFKVIDFLIDEMKIKMYSLGYINTCINDVLIKIEKKESQIKALQNKTIIASEIKKYEQQNKSEVVNDIKSSQRNKTKAERLGVQSWFREKLIGDLFKGDG